MDTAQKQCKNATDAPRETDKTFKEIPYIYQLDNKEDGTTVPVTAHKTPASTFILWEIFHHG